MQAKAGKDREQAGELIEVLMQDRPGDIELAVDSMNRRDKGWRKKLRDSLNRLPDTLAYVKRKITAMLKDSPFRDCGIACDAVPQSNEGCYAAIPSNTHGNIPPRFTYSISACVSSRSVRVTFSVRSSAWCITSVTG